MGKRIHLGILGLGQRGLQHLKVLWKLQLEGIVEIVALGDATRENLSEEKLTRYVPGFQMGSIRTYTDFDQLLSKAKPDGVFFCIPPSLHEGQVVRAAQGGVHVFVEKPMSLYLDEAVEMEQAIRGAGVISAVGFQRRYEPRCEAARNFLARKRMVMVTMVSDGSLEAHSVKHTSTKEFGGPEDRVWAKNVEWSGSTIVEAGIHQTDLMRYWCGDISWTQAAYVPRDDYDIEDGGDNPYAYAVTYGFQNGGIGNLLMSRLRKVYRTDGYQNILWDHGHLKFEADQVVAYHYDGANPSKGWPKQEEIRHLIPVLPGQDSTEAISRGFVSAIENGDESGLRSTFSTSMNSLVAVLGANLSHERGGERIDLESFLSDPIYAKYRTKPKG